MTIRRLIAALALVLMAPLVVAAAAQPATRLADADSTPPSIVPQVSGTPGTDGWFTSAVTVAWVVSDAESGIAGSSGCDPTTISSDTTGRTLTCSASNTDGLSAQASIVVKVDTTGPSVTGEPTSKPTQKGWYTQPLTVAFAGTDAVSGISTCGAPVAYGGPDTKSAAVSGSCTNGAGLSTSRTATFKYDSSPPEVTPSVSGKLGANGWYTGDVSVSWSVSDPVSDVDSSSGCGTATLTSDTGGTTLTCSATNGAGLTTQRSVTVKIDRTAPDTTITGGPSGTATTGTASFTFSASEPGATFACSLDAGAFQSCSSPQTYSGLADGSHSFQVRATDGAGNSDQTPAAQSWTVRATPPNLKLPGALTVEATSAAGANVSYAVSADSSGEPIIASAITCSPPSGSAFALGTTTVTCSVTNSYGVTASGSFTVTVVDTTAPRLTVPTAMSLVAAGPVPRTNPALSAFLAAARAVDLVDAHPTITTDAPATFAAGTTKVTFTARDAAGNAASATSTITIAPPPPSSGPPSAGPPTTSAAPDRTPPGDVRALEATAGDRSVTLTWSNPPDTDYNHVEVFRSVVGPGGSLETSIYSGRTKKLVDRGLTNDTTYQYVVVAVDKTGNRAGGAVVTAIPKAVLLLAPKNGAKLSRPPVLAWNTLPDATYYNVQLWRNGAKILSAWPVKARLALRRQWRYGGRVRTLSPATYRWYVWPGVGDRADKNYGPVLGMQTFSITRRKS
ncbi:MAG TPA: HYR domain-containing protein [Gaiellaceae bacterium]|nr:HYR domain-containing protein [Gaiellaceae bacterium]